MTGTHEVGASESLGPLHVLYKGFFEVVEEYLLPVLVPVEHTVEADGDVAQDVASERDVGLCRAAGADAQDLERPMLCFGQAGLEIDVCKCVELGHHDVDVVGADAVRQGGDSFAMVGSCDGVELARALVELYGVEILCDRAHATRVAHHDHDVGQVFGKDMQMEHGTVVIDDQFGAGYWFVVHVAFD